jgi:U4/U6.U5 tri-snRNP-associated protein 1
MADPPNLPSFSCLPCPLTGLGAALALLKETGALKQKVEWGGRTNDRSAVALQGMEEVYTGGSHDDYQQARIEVALTRRDEFGRVMTPKDRWRQLNYE